MKTNLTRMTIEISTTLHKKFKKLAIEEGRSMREIMVDYINERTSQGIEECPYSHIPNEQTIKAIKEAEAGRGLHRAKNAKDLLKQCGIKIKRAK